MVGYMSMYNTTTTTMQRVELVQISSGLCCRTLISI